MPIKWKKGKDITGGLLDLVCKAWDVDRLRQNDGKESMSSKRSMTDEQRALKKKIDHTGMGGLSFFAWFGFIGRRVSAEESAEATKREAQRRHLRKQGQKIESPVEDNEDGNEDVGMSLEIFPDGDDLAVAITEDLWPGAIKYFSEHSISLLCFRLTILLSHPINKAS